MAMDTHDDEAARRALLSAAESDTSPVATRARIDLFGLKVSLASCLLIAPVYIGLIYWWLDEIRRTGKETDGGFLLFQILFGGGVLLAIALFTRSSHEHSLSPTRPLLMSSPSRSVAPPSKVMIW